MQRKPSKNRNGRGPNAAEKAFQGWLKDQSCVWCGNDGPSIVDHCKGSTFGHNKVHVGHWFCIPQCVECDTEKTVHGKRQGNESTAWIVLNHSYQEQGNKSAPDDVWHSIEDWNK
tara:strand:- start:1758 stop:2102 length:345 start_codon:yes stop_codon:yes gene_type:complete